MKTGYPAILLLEGRLGVVVGGGPIAQRKARNLIEAGAKVRLVAPDVTNGIRAMAERAEIDLIERRYEHGDLDGAAIVIAATDDHDVNVGVHDEATERGIPVNVVDDVPKCTFIAPSIVRRGNLVIAISTGGAAPTLAVRLRERFERELGEEYGPFLEMMWDLRSEADLPGTYDERAQRWYRIVDEGDVLSLVREGKIDEAKRRALDVLEGRA